MTLRSDSLFFPRRESVLYLPDGRQLAWAEYGIAAGIPLIYCHGTPGSRLEAGLGAAAATRLGLRLLAIDRPGYGRSSPAPRRTLHSWVVDLEALARQLGLARFLVLGVSGGGPFALAAARFAPSAVAGLGLVGAVAPLWWATGQTHLPRRWRLLRRFGPLPGVLPLLLAPATWWSRRHPRQFLQRLAHHLPTADRAILNGPQTGAWLARSLAEALTCGSAGVTADLHCFSHPWGFSPEALTLPCRLWHGGRDNLVPPAFGHQLASALPDCRAHFPPAEGHYSLPVDHAPEIFSELLGAAGPQAGRLSAWYT